jgi:hypothetical protein
MILRNPISAMLLALTLIGCDPSAVRIEETRDQQSAWLHDRLSECMVGLTPDGAHGVRYRAGKKGCSLLGFDTGEGGMGTLRMGDAFSIADHHLSLTWRIEDISAEGVDIGYETRFNHASFGKDMIKIDRGRVRLPCRNQEP